jgi:tetratricopeptide (TPR) repeat protein
MSKRGSMQTSLEQDDAKRVDQALEFLYDENIDQAEIILRDICSRCPEDYVYDFTHDGAYYIKFWTYNEFEDYIKGMSDNNKQEIIWLLSAYPRACYYLAYILMEKQNLDEALQWLRKGQEMEPKNSNYLIELGVVYATKSEFERSFECYQEALELSSISNEKKAASLRGMGVQLIELQRLDEAEKYLKESIIIEPNSELGKQELLYLSQLRSRKSSEKKKTPLSLWKSK